MATPWFGSDLTWAAKIASVWGTALDCDGALNGGYVKTINGLSPQREQIPETASGYDGLRQVILGRTLPDFSMTTDLRWGNSIPWVHMFALVGGETSVQQGGVVAYLHAADFDDDIEGHFYTLCCGNDTDSIYREIPSIKPTGFTISVGEGGFLEVELRGLKTEVEDAANVVNQSFTSVTTETDRLRIPAKINQFRINQDVGALDADDKIKLTNFVLSVDRPMEPNYDAYGDIYASTGFMSSEPKAPTQVPEIYLSIPENDWAGNLWDADHRVLANDTAITSKADISFTGPVITSTETNEFKIEFPLLATWEVDTPIDHQNRIISPVTFRAMKPAAAPTGMTGITEYLRMSLEVARVAIYAKA
jgi:hypothetical protein